MFRFLAFGTSLLPSQEDFFTIRSSTDSETEIRPSVTHLIILSQYHNSLIKHRNEVIPSPKCGNMWKHPLNVWFQ